MKTLLDWEMFWREFEAWMDADEKNGNYHEWPEQQLKIQELAEKAIKKTIWHER